MKTVMYKGREVVTFENQFPQGDMYMFRKETVPDNAVRVEPDGDHHIVAHSETGHHHVVPTHAEFFTVPDDPMTCYLRCDDPVLLEHLRPHDTHRPVLIPKGVFMLRRQREETPEGWRPVQD